MTYKDQIYKLDLKVRKDLVSIRNTLNEEIEYTEPVKPIDFRKNKDDQQKPSSNKFGSSKFSRSHGRFSNKVNYIPQEIRETNRHDSGDNSSDDFEAVENNHSDREPPPN